MSLTTIVVWAVAVITIITFILAFTLLVVKNSRAERILVEVGKRDTEILAAHQRRKQNKDKTSRVVSLVVQLLLLAFVLFLVVVAIYTKAHGDQFPVFGNQVRLIGSNSMATVHEKTEKLVPEEKRTEHFTTEDLIILHDLPPEDELQLYDIVTYINNKNEMIVHRIVVITETESGGKRYTMRGDANPINDPGTIEYEDMRSIYGGKKMRGLGLFVRFTHTTFFAVAIVVCVYVGVLEEVFTKLQHTADKKRLAILDPDGVNDDPPPPPPRNPDGTFKPKSDKAADSAKEDAEKAPPDKAEQPDPKQPNQSNKAKNKNKQKKQGKRIVLKPNNRGASGKGGKPDSGNRNDPSDRNSGKIEYTNGDGVSCSRPLRAQTSVSATYSVPVCSEVGSPQKPTKKQAASLRKSQLGQNRYIPLVIGHLATPSTASRI